MTSTTPPTQKRSSRPAWLAVMRPEHWVKNILLFVAIPFAGLVAEPMAWARCAVGFVAFGLLASGVYVMNDLRDRAADAAHPIKRYRPIASGALGAGAAVVESLLLLAGGLAVAATLGLPFVLSAGGFVGLNVAYTFWLKHHAIVDVILVSLGFVVRAMASALAILVPISAWLVLCTFMLCLFIALAKRRSEVSSQATPSPTTRRVNLFYTPERTEHMLSVSAGLSIVTYSLYTLAPTTVARMGSLHLVWTVPLVVYALFRYYALTARGGGEDPVRLVLRDRVLWLVGLVWIAMVLAVAAIGHYEPLAALRGLLI